MVKGKGKKKKHCQQKPRRHSTTTASPRKPNTLEKQVLDLNVDLLMLIGHFKWDINNSLEKLQENTNKYEGKNKTIQDLKMEGETIKKSQR